MVLDNAIVYNKPDTAIYKTAMRIKNNSANYLGELHQFARCIPADSPEVGRVGDLEVPLSVLELLSSIKCIEPDLPFILKRDPLDSMFTYELEQTKPLPTPPLPTSATSTGSMVIKLRKPSKGKRDRKAEAERRKQRMLDKSAGFRGPPRTRNAHARAEAFEAEARAGGDDADGEDAAIDPGEVDEDTMFDSDGKPVSYRQRWKRTPLVLPGQADVPLVVEDVDKQRSFSMFDEGWILPSGTRRGGRAPVERHDGPPPRKRTRSGKYVMIIRVKSVLTRPCLQIDRQTSTLSNSTPATDNLTLARTDAVAVEEGEQLPHKREKSITIDLSESFAQMDGAPELSVVTTAPSTDLPSGVDAEPRVVDAGTELEPDPPATATENVMSPLVRRRRSPRPKRKVEVIEELDTPAIRRSKNLARKQRRQDELARLAREATQQTGDASVLKLEPLVAISGLNSTGTVDGSSRMSSPLSALTDMDDDPDADDEDDNSPRTKIRTKSVDETDISSTSELSNSVVRRPNGQIIVSAAHARNAAMAGGLGSVSVLLRDDELLESGTLGTSLISSALSPFPLLKCLTC